jgi:carboxypeptidase C (cathepsin A)
VYAYTATAGHMVAVDPGSSRPSARIFYVAFTLDGAHPDRRAVTFFYNGGPGSSSVFVLLGSFAPRRIKTSMPGFTPPAPYAMEDNPDSLLDRSDLVFINPVGTGYSAAIAPWKNRDFWGVDQDAASLKQFIKRYLTANDRWNSPKFLYGESYGTARSAVLSYVLHEDGVDLNGVTIQSSILDYTQAGNPVGVLPTAAADAWYHKKSGVRPRPRGLDAYLRKVCVFAQERYAAAVKSRSRRPGRTVRLYRHRCGHAARLAPEPGGQRCAGQVAFPARPAPGPGAGAGRIRRQGDSDRHRHRREHIAQFGRQRSGHDGGVGGVHRHVARLSQ